ncbi:ADP-ribosylation factor GTPase-activating protein effector protein 2 [[Candida] anglica]|uniref:ADP-ribosylation factor GTPase-activating protein effector protein 2 n=1 Tax=[Candida] anglica TaxID=148631 RepID=A0ABP0ECS3_9ASCO
MYNTSRSTALPSSKKTHSEKHKQILKQLLKEAGNKTCVDCKTATHPRWASWNLGCFICIRCSGIHRSMGTHISKVKSVDLDAWTDEQIESMLKWGNAKCNSYWEAKLPDGYVPDASKIENFIRTKYDMKKWASSSTIPNPSSLTGAGAHSASPTNSAATTTTNSPAVNHSHAAQGSLLDEEFGSFKSSPTPSSVRKSIPATSSSTRPVSNSPLSSSLPKLSSNESLPKQQQQQSAQSTGGSFNGRPDLKKSILSLYSSPSSSSSNITQPQRQTLVTPSFAPSNSSSTTTTTSTPIGSIHSLSNSLNGLNFNSTPSLSYNTPAPASVPVQAPGPAPTTTYKAPASEKSWTNEWSDAPQNGWSSSSNSIFPNSTNSTATASALDDDLFKNVWK